MLILDHRLLTPHQTTVPAGQQLMGIRPANYGMIVQVLEDQPTQPHPRLIGPFLLVQAGIGHYAVHVAPLVGRQLTHDQITAHVHRFYPDQGWVHVVTPDSLALIPLAALRKK